MSVYLHVTLEIHAAGLARFLAAMVEEITLTFAYNESQSLSEVNGSSKAPNGEAIVSSPPLAAAFRA